MFTRLMLLLMKEIFSCVCDDFECQLIEFDGEKDHVHLMVYYPPKMPLSKLVNSLKGGSSRCLRREFSSRIEKFYWKGVLWSPSYFASSCGGAPIQVVKQYIQTQKTPR